MQFTRHVTLVGCDWQKLETCLDMIPASNASTAAARKTAALKCLPAREELINSTSLLMNALLSSVSSAGCGQRVFSCAISYTKHQSFYQDRLGTKIGKLSMKRWFSAGRLGQCRT